MAMAHQPAAAILGARLGVALEEGGHLRFNGMAQKCTGTAAQHLGQRVGKPAWLGQLNNAIIGHGVSLLRWRSGGSKHPHDTPPYPLTPSPTFANSSEFEAESVCYLVCERLGITNPSANYLSGYYDRHGDVPAISLECVLKAAGLIEQMSTGWMKPRKAGRLRQVKAIRPPKSAAAEARASAL
jgi:hypothetical protein